MAVKKQPTVISESTLVPISLLIVIIGAISWLTNMHGKVSASEKQLENLNCETHGCLRYEIKQQGEAIARIEGALGTKPPDKKVTR